MGIAIDRELVEDINDPSLDVLRYCIEKHQELLDRYDKLDKYYNGEHDIEDRTRENDKAPNTKVMVNHAKYITDMVTGFVFGNPISYTPGKDKSIDPILEFYKNIEIAGHDTELGKDLSVFGDGLEVIYIRIKDGTESETEPMIKSIDPRGAFVVTDDTIEKNYLFGVHYWEKFGLDGESTGWEIDVYTSTYLRIKRAKSLDLKEEDTEEKEVKENVFKEVQITEYRNNEERQSDFEQQISQINAYNNLQSDRISDKEAFIDAILVLFGFNLADDEEIGSDSVIQAPPKGGTDGGAAAEYLTKILDEASTQILADSIIDDIHKTSYVPNMNDEKFSGNVSGEAMKYKLFALLQLLTVKTRYLTKGLRRRLRLLQNYYHLKNQDCDIEGTDIAIKANIPVNTSEVLTMISTAKDVLSLETLLKLVPFIDDPEEEIEKLIEQKIRDIKLNRQALGEDSHNEDIERPNEESEEEEDVA